MPDWVPWVKFVFGAIGMAMISAATTVEPSEAVWIMGTAGGLLGVALGEDRSVGAIVVHAILGICVALAGASLLEFLFRLPRPPVALGAGLVASRLTVATFRQIDRDGIGAIFPRFFRRG